MLGIWLRRVREYFEGWRAGAMPSEMEEPDVEYPSLLKALATYYPPSPVFVTALEVRIRAAYPRAVARGRERHTVNRPALAFALTSVLLATGLLVVWALGLFNPSRRIQFVPERAFAAAYDALLSAQTVSYNVDIEVSHGLCGAAFNIQLTSEELEALNPDERPVDGRGTVVSCGSGPQRFVERGEYDLEKTAFHSLTQGFSSNIDTASEHPIWSIERSYVEGKLYTREGTGEWVKQTTSGQWLPFDTGEIGGVPSGGLDSLKRTYDSAEDLGIEKLEGVEVQVFKASRSRPGSGISEEVLVWVGTRDGLPRKAIIQASQPESPLRDVLDTLYDNPELTNPGGAFYRYRDDPIVVRGDEPTHKTIQWTYTFDNYNEPVKIMGPALQDSR